MNSFHHMSLCVELQIRQSPSSSVPCLSTIHVSSLGLLATLVGYIIYERRSIEKSLYHVPSFFSFSAPCLWRVSLFFSVFWYSSSLQRYYSVVLWIVVAATLLAVFFFTWTSSSLFFVFLWTTLLVNHTTYDIFWLYYSLVATWVSYPSPRSCRLTRRNTIIKL